MWVLNQPAIWKRGAASSSPGDRPSQRRSWGAAAAPPRAYLQQGAGQRRGQGGPRKPAHRQAPGPAHPSETLQGRVPGRLAGPGTGPPRTRAREDEGNQWSPGSNNRTAEPSL